MGCSFPTFAFDDSSADCSHQDFMSKRRTVEFRQGRNWQLKAIGCFCFHRKLSANPPILGKRQNIFWGSVHFSHSVMSNSLWLHGLQHARLPCPSPTPGACSNSYPLSWWHHSTISSCHPLLPSSIFSSLGVFSNESVLCIRGPKYWASASASVLPMSIQDWFPLGWTGWISCSPRDSQESFPTPQFKSINSSALSFLYSPTLTSIHNYWKNHNFVSQVMSLLFNMLSMLVIVFLPRSKHFSTSWLQLPSAVILEPKKLKSVTVSIVSPSICHEVMGPDAIILVFWMLSFKPTFSLSSFTFIKRLFNSSLFSAIRVMS